MCEDFWRSWLPPWARARDEPGRCVRGRCDDQHVGTLSIWQTTWATFVGGFAASLVALAGVVVVEVMRGRRDAARERRQATATRIARRRASRNAAKSVLMELAGSARPLERMVAKTEGWEPMKVVRTAWDDQANRAALNDAMTLDALLDVEHAYHELEAIEQRLRPVERAGIMVPFPPFWDDLSRDQWKLADRILEEHIRPGVEHLHLLIAGLETLELAERGELERAAEALRELPEPPASA